MLAQDMIVRENLEATKGISNIDFTVQELSLLTIQELNSQGSVTAINDEYIIENIKCSFAAVVLYIYNKEKDKRYCLKIWRSCDDIIYKTKSWSARTQYTIEGFDFNQLVAPNVCLGLAAFNIEGNKVRLGKMLSSFPFSKVEEGVEYALVMKCLDEDWQLSYQLHSSKRRTAERMAFLAKEIAQMQKKLHPAPENFGNIDTIKLKWDLNRKRFFDSFERLFPKIDIKDYDFIDVVMNQVCELRSDLFEQRYKEGCIKRCHGDLKATNLWIYPPKTVADSEQLVALDCVDFRPEFCYIDTLSDIAMLAMDIEAYTRSDVCGEEGIEQSLNLSQSFLSSYLERMQEEKKEDILTLLEYYITEKAVVCSYVSILYDDKIELGMLYLEVARTHARILEEHLPKKNTSAIPERKTSPAF